MAEKQSNYEVVTARIIEALEAGVVPWRKPWNVPAGLVPSNGASGHVYRGINVLMLRVLGEMAGYSDQRWVTFKQALDLGGHVRKGEKAAPVVFWKFFPEKDEEGEPLPKRPPMLRRYSVFNVEQCEGLDKLAPVEPVEADGFEPVEAAEAIVAAYADAPTVRHVEGDGAYYSPRADVVTLPVRGFFAGAPEYYGTLFHELGHSTGHESRLGRSSVTESARFGSPVYSREELVAEFTAAFLLSECGMDEPRLDQSASYIKGWLTVLRNDARLAVNAAQAGQKAAEYILGRQR